MTSETPAEALLIRHGETAWSLSGQHTGSTDIPLTENGRQMARRLAPHLAGKELSLVLTSPLTRARDTCALAGCNDHAQIEEGLREWDYGDYEGLTTARIHQIAPDWMLFRDGCPGGERPEQVAARVDRVIARVRSEQGRVALFAHGHVLRMLVTRWIGLPPQQGCHFLLDTATLNHLAYYRGEPAIQCWNAPIPSPSDPAG